MNLTGKMNVCHIILFNKFGHFNLILRIYYGKEVSGRHNGYFFLSVILQQCTKG